MNQFHSSKKLSYSGYCRVRCDGSLIALEGKIIDVSYIVAKLTTLSGKNRTDDPELRTSPTLPIFKTRIRKLDLSDLIDNNSSRCKLCKS